MSRGNLFHYWMMRFMCIVMFAKVYIEGNVAGMLVYAKTGEDITPDCVFNMGGNQIGAKTLDLNKDFNLIAAQLDAIAAQFFGKMEVS